MTVAQRCRELFDSGYFCAESVLLAVAEHRGIDSGVLSRLATGFCGGISRNNGWCGALTGGIMALGLVHGRDSAKDDHALAYERVSLFIREFERRLGSRHCSGLLGCDIGTPEGSAILETQDLESRICAPVVETAGEILMPLLAPRQ